MDYDLILQTLTLDSIIEVNMLPDKYNNFEFCNNIDNYLQLLDEKISNNLTDVPSIQDQLHVLRVQVEEMAEYAKELKLQNSDLRNLNGRVTRVLENLTSVESHLQILGESTIQLPVQKSNQTINNSSTNRIDKNMMPSRLSYETDCATLDKQLAEFEKDLFSESTNFSVIGAELPAIRQKVEKIYNFAQELQKQKKDSTNLNSKVSRVLENLNNVEHTLKIFLPSYTQVITNSVERKTFRPVNSDEILKLLHPKAGSKAEGGKEIQKVEYFDTWLDRDYNAKNEYNYVSNTYKAYQSIGKSEGLAKSLIICIRGDGDCGYRAMVSSLLLELASDQHCQEKFYTLMNRFDKIVHEKSTALPGFKNLNVQCLQDLKNCEGNPEKLVRLLNDDLLMRDLTRMFRFLANAISKSNFENLPETERYAIEFSEGALELGSVHEYLAKNATLDVEESYVPTYLFASLDQISLFAHELGIGFKINAVKEGSALPQEPHIFMPQNSLLSLNMICRDNRHFDVIHQPK